MVPVVGQQPHKLHFAVLSTAVKATVASVEFVAVPLADQAVLHQRLMLNSDFENEIVAAMQRENRHMLISLQKLS